MQDRTTPQVTVTLRDLYSKAELRDKSERLNRYLSPALLRSHFPVGRMSVPALRRLMANPLDTVLEAYEEYATEEQEELIDGKMARFDSERIIVVAGDYLIDGSHHAIAAIRLRKPVRYIDLHGNTGGGKTSAPRGSASHQQDNKQNCKKNKKKKTT